MYMCWWKDVTDEAEKNDVVNELLNFAEPSVDAVARAAREWRERVGFSAPPLALFKAHGWTWFPTAGMRKRKSVSP